MAWAEFIGALILAVIIGAIFFYGLKNTGPWGSLWTFVLVLFLGIWLIALLADPLGPVWYGIAWIDFLLIGLLFALLLAAATPSDVDRRRHRRYYTAPDEEEETAGVAIAVGLWFWLMIFFFLIIGIIAAVAQ